MHHTFLPLPVKKTLVVKKIEVQGQESKIEPACPELDGTTKSVVLCNYLVGWTVFAAHLSDLALTTCLSRVLVPEL